MKPTRAIAIPSFTHRIGYQAGLLGGMATIISLLLIMGDQSTRDDIQLRLQEDTRVMLDQVLPAGLYDNNPLELRYSLKDSPFPGHNVAYLATKNGQLSGLAMEVVGKGYSGDIVLLLGVNEKGEITGVRTISHAETPGLGDKIEIKKNNWVTSFNGYSLENHSATQWQVKKDGGDFDQFTGATITPRAVVKAVKNGLLHYAQQRAAIEAQLSIPATTDKESSQ